MASREDFPEDVCTDVLIVGAGPAGYMAAVTLARYGVDLRIIDQRAETIQGGQASGECNHSACCVPVTPRRAPIVGLLEREGGTVSE